MTEPNLKTPQSKHGSGEDLIINDSEYDWIEKFCNVTYPPPVPFYLDLCRPVPYLTFSKIPLPGWNRFGKEFFLQLAFVIIIFTFVLFIEFHQLRTLKFSTESILKPLPSQCCEVGSGCSHVFKEDSNCSVRVPLSPTFRSYLYYFSIVMFVALSATAVFLFGGLYCFCRNKKSWRRTGNRLTNMISFRMRQSSSYYCFAYSVAVLYIMYLISLGIGFFELSEALETLENDTSCILQTCKLAFRETTDYLRKEMEARVQAFYVVVSMLLILAILKVVVLVSRRKEEQLYFESPVYLDDFYALKNDDSSNKS